MSVSPNFWKDKRVLLTGHTGFKGGWLSLWLQHMGAQVHGLSLSPPTELNLFEAAHVALGMSSSTIGDIRDFTLVSRVYTEVQPEIVFHLAAQPLVRLSYAQPLETYATNVMGTAHILEAARQTKSVKAVVNVTTDKCYENQEREAGYVESEPMGGHDPYSSSKACSELLSAAYRASFFTPNIDQDSYIALATARAGNVIGGGDWALDRLIPDALNAFEQGRPVLIRNPHAIRPWQHVLEPLHGYLLLAQGLYEHQSVFAQAWNFGPNVDDVKSVEQIIDSIKTIWGDGARWERDQGVHPHEATYLKLDISKATQELNWHPSIDIEEALRLVVYWEKQRLSSMNMRSVTLQQISDYQARINQC